MFINENLEPWCSSFFLYIYRTNKKCVMMKLLEVLSACFYNEKFVKNYLLKPSTKSNLCFIELSREIVDMEILVFHTFIKGNIYGYYKHMILARHFSTWLLRKSTTSQIGISRKPKFVLYFYISLVIHFVVSLTLVTLVVQIRKNRQCFSFGTYFSGWEMRLLDEITV